ncbi:MAG TPA: hypothetical protein VMV41_12225 [Cellulomonadaceae bacterium]|nr:hypothetical protein [Cellulomonadaceae bacterium]
MRERERAETGAIALPGLPGPVADGASAPFSGAAARVPVEPVTGARPTVVRRQPGGVPTGTGRIDQERTAPGRSVPAATPGPTRERQPQSGGAARPAQPAVEGYFPSSETGAVPLVPPTGRRVPPDPRGLGRPGEGRDRATTTGAEAAASASRWPFGAGPDRPDVRPSEPGAASDVHGQPVRSSVFGGGGARAAGTPTPMARPPQDIPARPVPTTPEAPGQVPLTWRDVRAAGGVPSPAPARPTPARPASTPQPMSQPAPQPRTPLGWGTGSVEETQITPAVIRPSQGATSSPRPSAWAGPPEVPDVSAEVPIPQWGPVIERPRVPGNDSAPRGTAPVAGQAWVPEPTGPNGAMPWGDVVPDDAVDAPEVDDERSYSLLHWVVLLFVALVLGALIYLLMNQATGGPGSQSSASALLGTSLIHEVALRSS